MSNGEIRLRFSPAPTGFLHIGSVRTALFNWLQARHTGGTFILRIEDTDVARSTDESIEQIQQVMRWIGLDWDEGPHLQSHRFDEYLAAAQRLLDAGDAYECFCTEVEVRERNEQAMREGRAPGYDGRCRDLTPAEREARRASGNPRSVRFRTPDEGRSTFVDVVRGEVSVEWSTISDFVIVRSNGTPVFFLANAVDDVDMRITHVLRGEDLIDSTHRVLALRRALGRDDQPVYAHMPLILGPGGAKLSKRHGAVSVEEYRDAGYLPHALVNYLSLLGWGPEDGREVLTIEELIAEFDIGRVSASSAHFDAKKLEWMNGEHVRRMSIEDLVAAVLPFARARYGDRLDIRVFERAVALAQERATTLVQIAEQAAFLFVSDEDLVYDEKSLEKLLTTERANDVLDAVIEFVEKCEWGDRIELQAPIAALGLKPGKMMSLVYTAIQGASSGIPLFESIGLLGRERTLHRLRAARARLAVT
jgi:glutamyl-tRNA synthetase